MINLVGPCATPLNVNSFLRATQQNVMDSGGKIVLMMGQGGETLVKIYCHVNIPSIQKVNEYK